MNFAHMKNEVIQLRKGLDIRLEGAPVPAVENFPGGGTVALSVTDVPGLRLRLRVQEGDTVRRGTPVLEDKKLAGLVFCAPASGRVTAVQYGPRRAIERIEIARFGGETELQPRADRAAIRTLSREAVQSVFLSGGAWRLIRRRPFSRIADPAVAPKSIFVNAMNTAPFRVDPGVAVTGEEEAFQAGLAALARLTDGRVHLCVGPEHAALFEPLAAGADRVQLHVFSGPHPAGNTSIHIHHVDPIRPGDTVWAVNASDLVQIGHLLMDGVLPETRVVALGGPGVKPAHRRHYRVPCGVSLGEWLKDRLEPGDSRLVERDVFGGSAVSPSAFLGCDASSVTVLPEGKERVLLGWMLPGLFQFSHSRLVLSKWLRPRAMWKHSTLLHGGARAMVATGIYDSFLPMRIYTDFLVRAVLAGDLEEAVQLGLLETDPEDFALAAFACPSKMDLVSIIRKGLEAAEAEGL